MDKLAAIVRDAEVRGVLAAFVDAGIIKVGGAAEFSKLAGAVCSRLGSGKYDLNKIAAAADAVLRGNARDKNSDDYDSVSAAGRATEISKAQISVANPSMYRAGLPIWGKDVVTNGSVLGAGTLGYGIGTR